jgi:tetratricopeptide (TPR) repeat protein
VKANPRWMIQQLNSLAGSHMNDKEYDKAELLLNKSLQICMRYTPQKYYLPKEDADVQLEVKEPRELDGKYLIWTLGILVEIFIKLNKPQLALENMSKIILISTRIYLMNSTHHLENLCNVADFYYRLRDFDSARALYLNVLSSIKKDYPAVHKTFIHHSARANLGLGRIELDQSNFEKAVNFLELSWKQHRLHKGTNSKETLKVLPPLARAYTQLGNYEKARTLVEFVGSFYTEFNYDDESIPELIELHKQILPHTKNPEVPPGRPHATRDGLITEADLEKAYQEE